MTRPLHDGAARDPARRPPDGHAGLWFDKFCNRWNVRGSSWTMESGKDHDEGRSKRKEGDYSKRGEGNHSKRKEDSPRSSPKLEWIRTVTNGKVGTEARLGELASRMVTLVGRRGGRFSVFTSESRFVTGLGRSHPVENGFAWHPTLGTPYLPGSAVKGVVRAWVKSDSRTPDSDSGSDSPIPDGAIRRIRRLFGDPGSAGGICFLDAVPIAPVQLEADVMTPHYAGWTEEEPPGDWRSPVPVPFLVTASGTSFLFGIVPCGAVTDEDLDDVMSWLCLALAWSGSGAKTAVGHGRFRRDDAGTDGLTQRLREREREREARIQAEREAAEREARRAAMDPLEREIEEILEERQDRNEPDFVTIIRMVEKDGRWSGPDRARVARWLERRMKDAKGWKEKSAAKNPARDKRHQRTLLVKGWLDEGKA